jgi:hypothetical protein
MRSMSYVAACACERMDIADHGNGSLGAASGLSVEPCACFVLHAAIFYKSCYLCCVREQRIDGGSSGWSTYMDVFSICSRDSGLSSRCLL